MPDAIDTVVCAPEDGWGYHPKHVEQFPDKINCVMLHLVGYILEYSYDARTHERQILVEIFCLFASIEVAFGRLGEGTSNKMNRQKDGKFLTYMQLLHAHLRRKDATLQGED
jgi:hypothetical protein